MLGEHCEPSAQGEEAYRQLLDHTCICARCQWDPKCPVAGDLTRAWREVRR